ncbi:MAG: trypsin-like peptidase domain-containing protein, partial [Thermoleophilia bacterium]|nr:trypsin-like peptidase domain-containing protein [Thermoleophilia bacterium]
ETTRQMPRPEAPEPPRRRGMRLAMPLTAAVIGGVVALGGAAVTGNLGGEQTTILRENPNQNAAIATDSTPLPEEAAAAAESDMPAGAESLSVQEIVRRTAPAVVEVSVGGQIDELQGVVENQQALGSGFVIDDSGHILTNQHVVNGFTAAAITFADGSIFKAEVLGEDASTDVAVLKVSSLPDGVTPVTFATSANLQVGDSVVAVGNPLGQERTATTGIVSALERVIVAPDNLTAIQNAIQTDAAINQGNSGGPLFDQAGRVIGINSQIATRGGGSDGIGFAVPIDTVRPVAESIIETGRPAHAWIGISGRPLNPPLAKALDLSGQRGVAIVEVEDGSPGADAGLEGATDPDAAVPAGADIIVEVAEQEIGDMADVSRAVSGRRVGDEISVTVLRDGERQELTFELGNRPTNIGIDQP